MNKIIKVYELLSKKGSWCQCDYALDKDKNKCSVKSKKAVSWCVYGAIERIYGNSISQRNNVFYLLETYLQIGIVNKYFTITHWNDGLPNGEKGRKQVVKVLKKLNI